MKKLVPNSVCHCSDSKSKLLQVKANNRCNGNCTFCIDKGNYQASIIDVPKMVEAILSEPEYEVVDVTGGEPLMDFDTLIEMLKQIRPYKKTIILNSNGSLLTKEHVECLNGLIDELRIALHHYDEKINSQIIHTPIKFEKLKTALKFKKFKATFNMVITKQWNDNPDNFIDELVSLCKELNVDAIRVRELKYVGINHGYEEYSPDHVKAYPFFKKTGAIVPKTSEELITTGCIDLFTYKGIEFYLQRLCGYKLKSSTQTLVIVYSDGRKSDDWIYDYTDN